MKDKDKREGKKREKRRSGRKRELERRWEIKEKRNRGKNIIIKGVRGEKRI